MRVGFYFKAKLLEIYYSFLAVVFNFILIQIFASTYYIVYFLALLIYIYVFSFKGNIRYAIIIMISFFAFRYYFDEDIYDFFIWIDYGFNFIYIDDVLLYTLSFLHLLFLFFLSSYENLKKMSYN